MSPTITTMRLSIYYGLLLAGASVLAACSGGAATTTNPNLSATAQAAVYTGPPPATADVQAFEANLWVNISGSNRCGNCHKAGGQSPTFAESDDINSAYQAALTVVNLSQPSELNHGQAGGQRTQLLARKQSGLRRHHDHLDQQLGERLLGLIAGHAGAADCRRRTSRSARPRCSRPIRRCSVRPSIRW